MEKKTVSAIMLTLLLIGMLTLAFNIQLTEAQASGITSFCFPVPSEKYKIIADFHDSDGTYVKHLGEDINPYYPLETTLFIGHPVRAIADGKIVWYQFVSGYATSDDGTSIAAVIEHDLGQAVTLNLGMGDKKTVTIEKICSVYGHIRKSEEYTGDRLPWKVNDFIKKGEIIGFINDREHNGAPDQPEHLHFGIRLGGHPGYWVYYGIEDIAKYPYSNVKYFAAPSEILPMIDILAGLQWLRNHQNTDGSWHYSVGITSMAALALLNTGYDEADPTVNKAIQYILANRQGDGSFGWGTYETSTAVWALVAAHNPNYNDEIENARAWLIDAQYDEGEGAGTSNPCYGGWRYGSSPGDGDLSNTQFALMALDAAYSKLCLQKPDPNDPSGWIFKAIKFTSRCQNRPISNDQAWAYDATQPSYDDGGFIYYPGGWSLAGGTKSYGSMTAAGIWSLRLCGVRVRDERIQAGLNWLTNNEDCSFDDNPGHPYDQGHCFLYYYYMTIAKALTMCFLRDLGGIDWFTAISTKLADLQCDDGYWVNAPASHGQEDISELATDYAILALQVKRPLPAGKLWMSIILASNATLTVYDPQGRYARLGDVTIPGASFEIDEEGRQIVNLTELETGQYTIELEGTADGSYSLTIEGYQDEERTYSKTFEGTIRTEQILTGSALVTSMVGALTIYTEAPLPPPPPSYTLTIYSSPSGVTFTVDGVTRATPWSGTYSEGASVGLVMPETHTVGEANYHFEYWELDSVNVGSANPYTVLMDKNHTLKAVFSPIPPPLSASISPLSASILVGQSVTFTSTVSGGYAPYSYQWYLDGAPVSGATSNTWTFAPTTTGSYIVYLNVTDNMGNIAKSNEASVTVAAQLTASISPMSASVLVGQSVAFTSTVSGGYTPYSYQWYLNGNPVSGATSASWTFTPTTSGIYYIHLKVTDAKDNTAQSETARITAGPVPVGGYSISIERPATAQPVLPYIALIAILTAIFTKLRPKTKRKH